MKFKNIVAGLVLGASVVLAGCESPSADVGTNDSEADEEFRATMITDENGVDDRSFNQSAWEGLEDWSASHDFSDDAIQYFQSGSESNYIPHLNTAVQDDYDMVYAIGFSLEEALTEIA